MKLFKRAIKTIAPLAASTLMLGSSLGFAGLASAQELGDFPQPFVSPAGVADVAIIIGADGAPVDTIAATDIQSALVVPIGSSGTQEVSGGESKDIPIGLNINDATYGWSSALTDSDVPSLSDTTVSIQIGSVSDEYDVHEEVVFGAGFRTGTGINLTSPDEDFKDNLFLRLPKKGITYRYVFDDSLKKGNYLSNTSTDEPVELNILGKAVEVSGATATSITATVGDKFTVATGETKEVNGQVLTLVEVGSGGDIRVDVDGESKIIGSGNTLTVNGLRVKNHARIYTTAEGAKSQATIIAGSDTVKTYDNGDEFIGEDEDDPNWIWQISGLDTATPKINVTWDQIYTDEDEVLNEGDMIALPNDAFTVEFASLSDGVWQDYKFEQVSDDVYNSTGGQEGGWGYNTSNLNLLKVSGPDGIDDAFKMPSGILSDCAGEETNSVYLYANENNINSWGNNISVYWEDKNDANKKKFCGSAGYNHSDDFVVTMQYDDATFNLDIVGINDFQDTNRKPQVRLTVGRGESQYLNLTTNLTSEGFEYGIGTRDGDAQTSDAVVVGSMGSGFKEIGKWEENTMTVDGLRIYDPQSNLDSDDFMVALPRDEGVDFRANINVYGTGAVITSSGTQFTKAPSATFLDTQVTTVQNRNVITVGGSAINRVSAEVLGLSYPTFGSSQEWQDATGVTGEGQALVKMFDSPYATDKVAMVVAGWSGTDTQRAGKAMYTGTPALSGQEALLSTVTETVTVA